MDMLIILAVILQSMAISLGVGMVPLSTISDFWSPLAFAIMFGLTFAMVLTLVLVPTLFYRNEKKKRAKALTHATAQR